MLKFKHAIAILLCTVLLLGTAPMSRLAGLEWPDLSALFTVNAKAETYGTYGVLRYRISDEEVTITGCDYTAAGELEIPDTIEGYPVTSIGVGALGYLPGLTSITIPDSVTSIDEGAFSGCTGLTTVTIPDGITYIPSGLFSGCTGLTSVVIPGNVTAIAMTSFANCTGLKTIECRAIDPPSFVYDATGAVLFYNVDLSSCKLIVPKGCLAAYQAAYGWKEFTLIEEDEPTAIHGVISEVQINGDVVSFYDISGRKLNGKPAQKGVYIVNGKKVAVK